MISSSKPRNSGPSPWKRDRVCRCSARHGLGLPVTAVGQGVAARAGGEPVDAAGAGAVPAGDVAAIGAVAAALEADVEQHGRVVQTHRVVGVGTHYGAGGFAAGHTTPSREHIGRSIAAHSAVSINAGEGSRQQSHSDIRPAQQGQTNWFSTGYRSPGSPLPQITHSAIGRASGMMGHLPERQNARPEGALRSGVHGATGRW